MSHATKFYKPSELSRKRNTRETDIRTHSAMHAEKPPLGSLWVYLIIFFFFFCKNKDFGLSWCVCFPEPVLGRGKGD